MWDVFISHASEDKAAVARPLYELLTKAGIKVWLDEHELHVGDSLRAKIDHGLGGSRYGVVVLSRAFFSKDWPERELNALFALESSSRKMILPVWHGVDQAMVAKYSPILADRLASNTAKGLPTVAREIAAKIQETGTEPAREVADAGKSRNLRRAGIGASLLFLVVSAAVLLSTPLRTMVFARPSRVEGQSYLSYGFVQLQGTRLAASTEIVLRVFLNASSSFHGVRLKVSGAAVEGAADGDLSKYLDPASGSPQAVEIHLNQFPANGQVATCLGVPKADASANSGLVWVRQVFTARDSGSGNVVFEAVGTPMTAANESVCQL
jgi:hypothetical protein